MRHPRDTKLAYLADFTGAVLRRTRMPAQPDPRVELELAFRHRQTGESTRLIFGGLDLASLPAISPAEYERGWQVPMGIGNPGFFETYDELAAHLPSQRTFYAFHLDAQNHWLDHHTVGVDGPLLHRDADDPSLLHLYLLGYERHALLNHFVLTMPDIARSDAFTKRSD